MGIAITGKILFLLGISAIAYVCYRVLQDSIKGKKLKKEYIQQIKTDIYYIEMLKNCPPFIILPDDHCIDIQNCLYRIADLNVDDIIKDGTLRDFITDHRNLEDYNYKSWHKYIVVL